MSKRRTASILFELLGVILLVASLWFTAIHGVQIAVIGVGCILLSVIRELADNRAPHPTPTVTPSSWGAYEPAPSAPERRDYAKKLGKL